MTKKQLELKIGELERRITALESCNSSVTYTPFFMQTRCAYCGQERCLGHVISTGATTYEKAL